LTHRFVAKKATTKNRRITHSPGQKFHNAQSWGVATTAEQPHISIFTE
jgi:hypothetical protein